RPRVGPAGGRRDMARRHSAVRPRLGAAQARAPARRLGSLPAILAGFWPAITRRQSPPSSLPRLPALAADECGLWLGARDPETRQHHWKEHQREGLNGYDQTA